MSGDPILVDARGMLCPWPVLRLCRAARQLVGSGSVRILADDPAAPRELQSLCEERGWDLAAEPGAPGEYSVKIS
ncbi:MAG: sulfurtransferase TusA family protein [Allosphingosinicella sp.]